MVVNELLVGKVTPVKPEQPKNILVPIVVTLFGIVTLVKLVQFSNAEVLMVVNELLVGKVTLARLEQPLNALSPILVTLLVSWKVTLANLEQR
jgi:hypothetical protein